MDQTFCCDAQRRIDVANSTTLNGIDFLEVVDVGKQFQQGLRVHFLRAPAPAGIVAANVAISGGERITGLFIDQPPKYDGDALVLHVNAAGDFSTYTLSLVQPDGSGLPMTGMDPVLSQAAFSFKIDCPSPFDTSAAPACLPVVQAAPELNYLAKDYAAFRQSLLDRLAVLVPDWNESHVADFGITVVELLAYVADALSYQQDAVATEAYLGTARLRTSVRRHARLVDYFMHEGCSARAWAIVAVSGEGVSLPAGTPLVGNPNGLTGAPVIPTLGYAAALVGNPTVFETAQTATLFASLATIGFHTWGDRRCALPRGATRATLRGRFAQLKAGDVLVFEEMLGPETGLPADADPQHRQAVRLVTVALNDANGRPLSDPLYDQPVTEIQWADEDALAFPLCLSARIAQGSAETDVADISVAHGNVVLADHGRHITTRETLGSVPAPALFRAPADTGLPCADTELEPVPPRFRPRLAQAPLTWAMPADPNDLASSAAALSKPSPAQAIPAVQLQSRLSGLQRDWTPRQDLLGSNAEDNDFVVEPDDAGAAWLRFGDGLHGRRPPSGTRFSAIYRIGNGRAGNVGAQTLTQIVADNPAILGVRQPLAAQGGTDPESIASVRAKAPFALRTQQRAVTVDDYGRVAAALPGIQSAAATMRWTGSWHTVFITAEKLGGGALTDDDRNAIKKALEGLRMAGHDIEVEAPIPVPLDVSMRVTAKPDYFRADIARAVAQVFSSRMLPNGKLGFFHPDNFRIGQDVYSSPLYAAAMAIDGVASVQITRFQRRDAPGRAALDSGMLAIGRLELARLDNNPDFPERGVFDFSVGGGK
ncbi:putative baseplate assembly protein [Variovorax humicola]|uniref:Baseplate assembly protein n=1 Tax=Variovorax humicola TaxID=1769758 RepID=A0ABU8VZ94_9BURK